ncbi:MAG: hypothetical protein FWC80_02200 [Firmicutes bacterium]|nr:hypothetical protein [Bacillota bacterium]
MITWAILLGALAIGIPLNIIIFRIRYKWFLRKVADERYDRALKSGKKLQWFGGIRRTIVIFEIASIYLSLGDIDNFEKQLNKAVSQKILAARYYWTTFAKLLNKDLDGAREQYAIFLNCPKVLHKLLKPYEYYNNILLAAFTYEEGNYQFAKERIEQIYPQLSNSLTLKYFASALQNIEGQQGQITN